MVQPYDPLNTIKEIKAVIRPRDKQGAEIEQILTNAEVVIKDWENEDVYKEVNLIEASRAEVSEVTGMLKKFAVDMSLAMNRMESTMDEYLEAQNVCADQRLRRHRLTLLKRVFEKHIARAKKLVDAYYPDRWTVLMNCSTLIRMLRYDGRPEHRQNADEELYETWKRGRKCKALVQHLDAMFQRMCGPPNDHTEVNDWKTRW